MGKELDERSLEDRKARVLLALHILIGDRVPPLNDEESAVLWGYRDLRQHGYGRMEVVIFNHQIESINSTITRKRKDLLISPETT